MIRLKDNLAIKRLNSANDNISKKLVNENAYNSSIYNSINKIDKCFNEYLPLIYYFDYHRLLMATFCLRSNLFNCKLSNSIKSDSTFNWKSFYFLIFLTIFNLRTMNCISIQNTSFSNSVHNDLRQLNNHSEFSGSKSIDSILNLNYLNGSNLSEFKNYDLDSKMKRRFVDNNEQKGAQNQEKVSKMLKMYDHYEQQFDTLKKRLNTSTNSSFPINRQQKSIMQRQFNLENGLQSSSLLDSQNLITNNTNEINLIPETQQYRYMTIKSFCEICFCNGLKIGTLKCNKNNQIKFIPILPTKERNSITEM